MAEKSEIKYYGVSDGKLKIANVSRSVGKNGVNQPDDVVLVNNLLWIVNSALKFTSFANLPSPGTSSTNKLETAIELYQYSRNFSELEIMIEFGHKTREKLSVDGRINHAREGHVNGKNNIYTIVDLNTFARYLILRSSSDIFSTTLMGLFFSTSPSLEVLK
jgi:hypothetical protein